VPETIEVETRLLRNLWDEAEASRFASQPLELLRYRSNLLGADLRITNFGGGNTSSKFTRTDPLTEEPVRVLAVKGSGGDLRSIAAGGFAIMYLDKLERLVVRYRGESHEDEMVAFYPLSAVGDNRVAASIDTPLHAFLPFDHVDHLHPDWAIALAASANGRHKLEEFNQRYERRIVWVPWQRPGFELALMLRRAVAENPGCDGIVLASHGLFTWGNTQADCYRNSIRTIDQMGQFVGEHAARAGRPLFGGAAIDAPTQDEATVAAVLPHLRGAVSSNRRVIAHVERSVQALTFASSAWAQALCALGTSCPDHFLRTRISPMFVPWNPAAEDVQTLCRRIDEELVTYRENYVAYYNSFAGPESPPLRDSNPSVVVIPAVGVFGFARDKREARITTEFFVNAIHVMAGATALEDGGTPAGPLPQARRPEQARHFSSFHNYVALPRAEAFRIEYWALEDAKLRRMPLEQEFSRRIALIVGGASGIGREVALQLARHGAHIVVADLDTAAAEATSADARKTSAPDRAISTSVDLSSPESVRRAIRTALLEFGGLDVVINTAAIYPSPQPEGATSEAAWSRTLLVNVTGNHVLADEAFAILRAQNLPAVIVLTSSANAVVPKHGTEPYDVSKAAVNHLVRELAVGFGPLVRVNGIAPATVIAGSAMFPRDRVIGSLTKYGIAFDEGETTDALRARLAEFYAQRTITRRPILPIDCANAICWLASDESATTTGHIIPVDGGLVEAFLR
jgi:rhamnose utilization protein RhaD (predicted bifunctional aldolase and dehydrogenase)/NAD(P)-dependent dehydrogenase (short-subunit alcohol dehydrogenase family)